jgi:hypothetical protein
MFGNGITWGLICILATSWTASLRISKAQKVYNEVLGLEDGVRIFYMDLQRYPPLDSWHEELVGAPKAVVNIRREEYIAWDLEYFEDA